MDRVAIAREERRRQVTEELEFERDRAGELHEEIKRLVLELEGPGIDEEVFATMPAEDVELIRAAVQATPTARSSGGLARLRRRDRRGGPGGQRAARGRAPGRAGGGDRAPPGGIVASERRQQALEAYLEALGSLG